MEGNRQDMEGSRRGINFGRVNLYKITLKSPDDENRMLAKAVAANGTF